RLFEVAAGLVGAPQDPGQLAEPARRRPHDVPAGLPPEERRATGALAKLRVDESRRLGVLEQGAGFGREGEREEALRELGCSAQALDSFLSTTGRAEDPGGVRAHRAVIFPRGQEAGPEPADRRGLRAGDRDRKTLKRPVETPRRRSPLLRQLQDLVAERVR